MYPYANIYIVYVEVAITFPDTLKVSGPYYSSIVSGAKFRYLKINNFFKFRLVIQSHS